jgi:hypothetical protein
MLFCLLALLTLHMNSCYLHETVTLKRLLSVLQIFSKGFYNTSTVLVTAACSFCSHDGTPLPGNPAACFPHFLGAANLEPRTVKPESSQRIIEGQAFLSSYDLAPSNSIPSFPSVSSTDDTQEERERETTC